MWGIPVPSRVPSGGQGWGNVIRSGSGVPADALGNLGDTYCDTEAQRWYLKRWVGNHSGTGDVILFPKALNATGEKCSISLLVNPQFSVASANLDIFVDGPNGEFSGIRIFIGAGGTGLVVQLRSDAGVHVTLSSLQQFPSYSWSSVSVLVSNNILSINIGSINVGSANAAGWTPRPNAGSHIFTTNTANDMQIANVAVSGPGYSALWPIADGSGSVIRDISGGGTYGDLTDASPTTFWIQTWVPLDLLT